MKLGLLKHYIRLNKEEEVDIYFNSTSFYFLRSG